MAISSEGASTVRKRQLLFGLNNDGEFSSQFVDAYGAEYSRQAQAWRFLGVYIDCRPSDEEEEQDDKRRRTEGQDGEEEGNQQDQNQEQGNRDNEQNENEQVENGDDQQRRICSRYALWAAVSNTPCMASRINSFILFCSRLSTRSRCS